MKKSHLYFIFLLFFSTSMLFISCAEKGPSGPAGTSGKSVVTVNFQEGIYPDSAYTGATDTRIYSLFDTDNYGTCDVLTTGFNAGYGARRSMLKFDLSAGNIPVGADVVKAYLTIYVYDFFENTVTCSAYAVTKAWTEGTGTCSNGSSALDSTWLNYTTGSAWTSAGGDFSSTAASNSLSMGTTAGFITFELTPQVVQDWLDSPVNNNGLILKSTDETNANRVYYYSSESSTTAYRPRLTVYYTAP